jgi:hypothetical protein
VPVRVLPVLADALTVTDPFAAPAPTPTTASHDALLAAVQEQPAAAVIATVLVPPAGDMDADVGAMAYAQLGALGACCVTTKV